MRPEFGTAQVLTPGTEVRITTSVVKVKSGVFKARHSNVGAVYLGLSTVTSTNGQTLLPGDAFRVSFGDMTEKPDALWVDAATADDRLDWHLIFEE